MLPQLVRTPLLPSVTRLRPADGAYHTVVYSALTTQNADAAIAEQVAQYRAMGKPFEWKVYGHDRPADQPARKIDLGGGCGYASGRGPSGRAGINRTSRC